MPTVKVELDNIRDGELVEIPYLGLVPNDGQTHDVGQTKWDRFVNYSASGQALEEGTEHYEVTTESQNQSTEEETEVQAASKPGTLSEPVGSGRTPSDFSSPRRNEPDNNEKEDE